MKIRLDERGRISRIEQVENDISHQLIEEYMLLANEAVAARLMSQNQPAIYRVHEAPDERRLQEYREEVLSHHMPCGNLTKRQEVQKLLQKLDTLPIGAGAQDRFPALAHARALRRRTARPLRSGQIQIHAFHVAHPPLRRPGGASRAVPMPSHGAAPFAQGNRRAHFGHGTQLRRRRTRQQGRETVRLPESATAIGDTADVSGAGHRCAQLRVSSWMCPASP